ncbi:TetR/AcrR family transcriptional regulator [Streptomyces sp. H10-C2]|uniref:TetR/AcrR family transcriptional regulator n=1 Tax=unclassified Streptomyces TaxID=2593676 RepID=UPI0024BA045E|nr:MULTISPECIES: TetR/AcrR family transcriptional regulator [unclassified Streptomyces]MDJ0347262.1 TetR/AcrR family transcriptional regulator [Streptomyces sp. PH10-H1]MDJ0375496.1 TetR/AcrR family transcriptional regulator [Streptomyces sp. H10-C2]
MATKTTADRPATPGRPTARERLLAAANELFYEEGIHVVGIDRVIERAGVAKATLYSAYGNKDGLISAYLAGRHEIRRRRVTAAVARHDVPREQLLAIFDALGEAFAEPTYRGCAFLNASAEVGPDSPVIRATDEYRGWVRSLFTDLARAAGAADPEQLASQLVLLYDGAGVSARMDRDPGAAVVARTVATALIDAALADAAATAG